ncbi:MAG: L-2-amino-thiazoline-4-carboxylic acid hydrolase, partial [Bacillota bacterium]|nr:L-2-amino-thiazoline-4-carboxylic acid hydrolase [Bacillota bacterium]
MDENEKRASNDKVTVSVKEATEQVQLLARRMALMYHHIGQVLTEQLGKDRAKQIMKEAIWRYGTECGELVKEGVTKMGLPLTPENFNRVPDLPKYGWERELIFEEGEPRPKVNYCPLADVWISKGSQEMGRIYCYVDQSKFQGYNPCIECIHTKNVLDGDPYCVLSIHPVEPARQSIHPKQPAGQAIHPKQPAGQAIHPK